MNPPLKSRPECPKEGWTWLRAVDLYEGVVPRSVRLQRCEFCSKEKVRYVHYLCHSAWKEVIAVGIVCANVLSGNPQLDAEERRLRNLAQRKANFLKLKSWRISTKGNYWIEYQDHHIIVVRCSNGKFTLRIDGKAGKLFFLDKVSAMARASDVVMRKIERGR
jgi:hypothetical protein